MKKQIIHRLFEIERDHNVKILYACESGSRAWGFESEDSDYDVRFIYAHPTNFYLSIAPSRDVIEFPIEGKLDISGWDIRKALQLFKKTNPPLLEWLYSPIVYIEEGDLSKILKDLLATHFNEKPCAYHYWHMGWGNWQKYIEGKDQVSLKKYLYVLRPLFAIEWLMTYRKFPPTSFRETIDGVSNYIDQPVIEAIDALIADKKKCKELGKGKAIDTLNEFISKKYSYYKGILESFPSLNNISYERLDEIFRGQLYDPTA